uniref:Adenylate kinase n=1 Tax=Macrostomum lignano TaxID=282301 RepID=A0A1I8FBG1_9PLAT
GRASGKGTQCEKITAPTSRRPHSVNGFSRAAILPTELRHRNGDKMLRAAMDERARELVPLEVVLDLLAALGDAASRPRQPLASSLDQAVRFEADWRPCRSVLFFNLDEARHEAAALLKRGETSGRFGLTNEATIVKRFQTFQKLTRPP